MPRRPPVPPEISSARKYKAWELRVKHPRMTFKEITKILNEMFPAYPLKSEHQAVEKMIKEAEREYIESHKNEVEEVKRTINASTREKFGHQKSTVVYLIRAENGLVKIGKTSDFEARFKIFDFVSPVNLELIHLIKTQCADEVEKRLHGLYKAKKVKREWFALSAEDIQTIIENES